MRDSYEIAKDAEDSVGAAMNTARYALSKHEASAGEFCAAVDSLEGRTISVINMVKAYMEMHGDAGKDKDILMAELERINAAAQAEQAGVRIAAEKNAEEVKMAESTGITSKDFLDGTAKWKSFENGDSAARATKNIAERVSEICEDISDTSACMKKNADRTMESMSESESLNGMLDESENKGRQLMADEVL